MMSGDIKFCEKLRHMIYMVFIGHISECIQAKDSRDYLPREGLVLQVVAQAVRDPRNYLMPAILALFCPPRQAKHSFTCYLK